MAELSFIETVSDVSLSGLQLSLKSVEIRFFSKLCGTLAQDNHLRNRTATVEESLSSPKCVTTCSGVRLMFKVLYIYTVAHFVINYVEGTKRRFSYERCCIMYNSCAEKLSVTFCKYCTVIIVLVFCTFVFIIVNICHVRFCVLFHINRYVPELYERFEGS